MKHFLIALAVFGLAILAGRLLYQNAGLPLWACLLIIAPPGGAILIGVVWHWAEEDI